MDLNKLPFVVQPKAKPVMHRYGSEASGLMEIPVKGYLTTGEKSFVQQAMSAEESTVAIIALARQVATEYNVSLEVAYNEVLVVLGGRVPDAENALNHREMQIKFNKELSAILTALSMNADKEKMVAAIAMLRYRVNPTIEFEDVMTMHPDLINGLYEVYLAEQKGDMSILEKTEEGKAESLENIEKKPSRRRKTAEPQE